MTPRVADGVYGTEFLERVRRPIGYGELAVPRAVGRATNALCGDEIEIDIRLQAERVAAVAHRERACAIVVASASLLAEVVPGRTTREARELAAGLEVALAGGAPLPELFGALAPVRLLPTRRRCALLPWEALLRAIAAGAPDPPPVRPAGPS